jgi:uncharacterized protein YbaP (TraB family)
MFYRDGAGLSQTLAEPLLESTLTLLGQRGVTAQMGELLKPWAAYLTLSVPLQDSSLALDFVLQEKAQAKGMQVHGLESIVEQTQTQALAALSSADQIALLTGTVCHHEVIKREIENTLQLYVRRDLAGLVQQSRKYHIDDEALHERVMNSLIAERNTRMVERMEPILQRGDAFVAIGALHLPDHDGVLAMLQKRGFRIRLIY